MLSRREVPLAIRVFSRLSAASGLLNNWRKVERPCLEIPLHSKR